MSTPPASPPPPDMRDVMRGLAIILAFNLAGLFLAETIIPLPAAVIGLCLLSAALFSGLVKVAWVEGGASVLLQSMMLFFVPALVGILDLLPVLGSHLPVFLLATVGSLLTVLLVTGFSLKWLTRRLVESPPVPSATNSNNTSGQP